MSRALILVLAIAVPVRADEATDRVKKAMRPGQVELVEKFEELRRYQGELKTELDAQKRKDGLAEIKAEASRIGSLLSGALRDDGWHYWVGQVTVAGRTGVWVGSPGGLNLYLPFAGMDKQTREAAEALWGGNIVRVRLAPGPADVYLDEPDRRTQVGLRLMTNGRLVESIEKLRAK
jgi:hypothetical protein